MAGVVEFLIKVQDGLTAPLAKITTNSGSAKSALNQLTESNKKLKSMIISSGVSINDLDRRIKKLQEYRDILPAGSERKIRDANTEINKLTKQMEKMQTMNGGKIKTWAKEAFEGLPEIVKNPLIAAGAAAMFAFNEGMKQNKDKLDFKLLVGDKAGKEIYEGAKGMKRYYGDDATAGAKQLVAHGVDTGKVNPMLESIGKVAAGNAGKFNGLITAFGQINKEGKLTEGTMTALSDNGFKPLTLLQKTFGQDTAYWQKRLADGNITMDEVSKALSDATDKGGIFANTLKEIDASPTGLWNRLTTGVTDLAGKVAGLLMPVVTPVFELLNYGLDLAIAGFDRLQKLIEDNSGIIAGLAAVVGGAAAAWAVYQGWVRAAWLWQSRDMVMTALLTGLKGVQATVVSGLTTAWIGLTTAMAANPIGAIIAGVVLVIGGIVLLATKFEWARKIVYGVWESIKAVMESIKTFFSNLFGGGNKKYVAIDVAYKKGADEASAEFAAKKAGVKDDPMKELLDYQKKQDKAGGTKDTQTENGINAVSGGGAKNITVSIGKMIGVAEMRVSGNVNEVMGNIEQKIEEVMVRALASASGRAI